ncbi:MAG: hypothetical protein K8U03_04695 [Planctomycetia bacterium]|nr:hypothetical protein [Planctomycetia bacterium]
MTHRVNNFFSLALVWSAAWIVGAASVLPAWAANDAPGVPSKVQVRRLGRTDPAEIQRQILRTTAAATADDVSVQLAIAALWSGPTNVAPGEDPLERIARTATLFDDRAASLVRICSGPTEPWLVPDQAWLRDMSPAAGDRLDPWLRDQLRLYFGRWLAQRKMYDQALVALAGLEPTDVVDPASLLFYQAAAYHHQLRKAPGLRAIDRLLNDVDHCPARFQIVAGLMREDLKKLEDESLDHIARRMEDIRRRLDHGRADKRTRRIEDGVIASLDKMIEDLEKKQQQGGGGGGGGGGSQSGQPMQDSQIGKQKGPGQTDPKDIGRKSDWGDLPPEAREQIKQQIGRDLPAHYYDLIQQYFNNPERSGARPK